MINSKEQSTSICVLGGGPAGYVAAIRAAQLGTKVTLIESREIGGTCLNRGCIPTKALLKTPEVLYMLSKSKELGIAATVSSVDGSVGKKRKDRIVKSLRMGVEHLLSKNGIELLRGKGRIESSKRVIVKTDDGEVVVNCDKMIITTGSEPLIPGIPGIPGIGLEGVITSDEALELTETPESITIIGAGAIGMEFATLYNSLGSKVTVIEFQGRIIPDEDQEITAELLKIMKRQGIRFKLAAKVLGISEAPDGLETHVQVEGEEVLLLAKKVLVAVGRKLEGVSPDISALGIELRKGSIGKSVV